LSYYTNETETDTFFQYELGFLSSSTSDLAMVDLGPKSTKRNQKMQGESHYHFKPCI